MQLLLTGPVNSGKSRYLSTLVMILRNTLHITIGGIINHADMQGGIKVGYICESLMNGRRQVFAQHQNRITPKPDDISCGSWIITADGIAFARDALSSAVKAALELVIIDEFGILEVQGRGLRDEIDVLVSSDIPLIIVVRESLVDSMQQIYADNKPEIIDIRRIKPDTDSLKDSLFHKWFPSHIR